MKYHKLFGKKIKHLTKTKILCIGNISKVYVGYYQSIKCIVKICDSVTNSPNELKILNYLKLTSCADHVPNLLTSVYNNNNNKILIIMEYINGKNLYCILEKNLYKNNWNNIFKNLTRVLYNLHSHGIIHHDLKPENIIVMNNLNIKIIDFGFSCTVNQNLWKTMNIDFPLISIGGTISTAAPEKKIQTIIDHYKCDIYSLGIIFYVCLYKSYPYYDNFKYLNTSTYIGQLIQKLTTDDPLTRPSLLEVYNILNII